MRKDNVRPALPQHVRGTHGKCAPKFGGEPLRHPPSVTPGMNEEASSGGASGPPNPPNGPGSSGPCVRHPSDQFGAGPGDNESAAFTVDAATVTGVSRRRRDDLLESARVQLDARCAAALAPATFAMRAVLAYAAAVDAEVLGSFAAKLEVHAPENGRSSRQAAEDLLAVVVALPELATAAS